MNDFAGLAKPTSELLTGCLGIWWRSQWVPLEKIVFNDDGSIEYTALKVDSPYSGTYVRLPNEK